DYMQQGQIDMGHARAILTLKTKEQIEVAKIGIEKGLSVRQTEQLVREWSEPKPEKEKVNISPDIEQLTQKLSERFGANVKIDHNQQGKGKM
ncbi:chromosome partitioning protein, partial [Acinetobacter junii]